MMNSLFITIQLCILSSSMALLRGGSSGSSVDGTTDAVNRNLVLDDASPPLLPSSRIIGGSETSIGQFSYTVSLQDQYGHFCGGSLIAKDVVLSASHCQHGGPGYKAVIGRSNLNTLTGEEVVIKSEIVHPKYDWATTNYDYMVLILEQPTTQDVDIITLSREVVPVGAEVSVQGWGDTDPSEDTLVMSPQLQTTDVFIMDNAECEQSSGSIGGIPESYRGQITENMVCARDVGEDSCQGDSGGPLVTRSINSATGETVDVQVGIVSWGIGCASPNFPGVYSRISTGYDWIREQVCRDSVDPPASFDCGNTGVVVPPVVGVPPAVVGVPPVTGVPNENWRTIVQEDFTTGFGIFNSHRNNAWHYLSAKERNGVVRLNERNGFMYFRTRPIPFEDGSVYSKIKVSFSFYAIEPSLMEDICLDSWTDSVYLGEKCLSSSSTSNIFEVAGWQDDSIEFDPSALAQTVRIRFRVEGKQDVLLDTVEISGLM
ncbi:hypothetical protein ACHAWU_009372 [Discostella pseudostelligera]|uniref:Peptidase S1 domain-containing protein n=1 Tax=Discostella pseudostelligera TaxID=259834 RepID=A0ABD3N759_9STRA